MKISLIGLKEFLPTLKATPSEIARRLTESGLEVESIVHDGQGLENIIIAIVTEKSKHPNADRLSICKVFNGQETLHVVCGAPNVREGGKYPFASIGAKLPNGLEIKQANIRQVDSFGMLCSAKELGLSEISEGLLELDEQAQVGQLFAEHFQLKDTILDINITPNRGDCLSHLGVAREIAALFDLTLNNKKTNLNKGIYTIKDYVKVKVSDSKGCKRYVSRVIRQVKVGPSPKWLSTRLDRLGIRSINNIVDATNLVMLETGHPLHAFDHRTLRGGLLEIRNANENNKFVTLDGVCRALESHDLVIADAEAPVALAGIMGGANSEIRDDTTTVVLEAASFDPDRIRKTARRLGLHSESSVRFERFVPSETVRSAMDRLIQCILDFAGGEVSREVIDIYPHKERGATLLLRTERLDKLLGIKIPPKEVTQILKALTLDPLKTKRGWRVSIPPYRSDLTREMDLIEEVIRMYGIDYIKPVLPEIKLRPLYETLESQYEDEIKRFLVSHGFMENIHLSFTDATDAEKLGLPKEEGVQIKNPLNAELSVLRQSLVPSLLKTYGNESNRYFELRSIYKAPSFEQKRLTGIYSGELFNKNWKHLDSKMDFFYGKGLLSLLFEKGQLPYPTFEAEKETPWLHPSQSVRVIVEGKNVGVLGQIHPAVLNRFGIKETVYCFDLNYSELVSFWGKRIYFYKPISPFPQVTRDLALISDRDLAYQKIVDCIHEQKISWLKNVSLFDIYEGESIPSDKKSLALSLVYENLERTLTDEEVNEVHFKLVQVLKDKLGVELR